jgi:hypothetical protein
MAFVYHAFFHILTDNGDKTLVDEFNWASKRLTGEDLTSFNADMEEATAPLADGLGSGQIVVKDLEETVSLSSGQTVTITVGKALTFPGATSKFEFHPNFYKWAEVMKQDPNLVHKPAVWVDETP